MSKNIVDKIKDIPDLNHAKGCVTSQIKDAQAALNMAFPEDYLDYVKAFGAICFFGTEWTGLNVQGYLNTVVATKMEKSVNAAFPDGFFVLEDMAIDAKKAIVNEKGEVFTLQRDKKQLLCKSLSEYLSICISRRN